MEPPTPTESNISSGIDISGDGGVIKHILREGTGEKPPPSVNVNVHYVGTLENGQKFDSSRDRGDFFKFVLGKGQVIKAWDLGVASMKKGELSKLICRSDYAYGENRSPPTIPANATLHFEVELFDWDEPEPDTAAEKIKVATKVKDEGNGLFKEGKFEQAIQKYNKTLDYFKNTWGLEPEETKSVDSIKLASFLNLASCQLKTKDNSNAILNCCKALDIDTNNVKALFRRGQGYLRNSEFTKAKSDLMEAAKLDPNNKEIRQELDLLKKKLEEYKNKEKQMFSGLFKESLLEDKKPL